MVWLAGPSYDFYFNGKNPAAKKIEFLPCPVGGHMLHSFI